MYNPNYASTSNGVPPVPPPYTLNTPPYHQNDPPPQQPHPPQLPRLDFPSFDGVEARSWIRKAERYFGITGTEEWRKVEMAAMYLTGQAEVWLYRAMARMVVVEEGDAERGATTIGKSADEGGKGGEDDVVVVVERKEKRVREMVEEEEEGEESEMPHKDPIWANFMASGFLSISLWALTGCLSGPWWAGYVGLDEFHLPIPNVTLVLGLA
ncbi:hypothetical protein Droror1_Dr00023192 [Drosera rotundifolia]